MIDLTPGRKSIQARYGVPPPRAALAAILADHVGPETVAAILQRLGAAEARYNRAAKVDDARRMIERLAERKELSANLQKVRAKAQKLLDHAAEYIEGTWRS
jgi:hypothetical protein